ncbi:MAG: DNA polymerase III subunit gamma/tau [Prevotella sp.]|uniref:DNA polymerase III subunit gamma/tau n=1 Tax=Prevotella sp. TaxID=59823 RepID=UPI002A2DC4A3|nr:DNA polymerase III subunit gamma/tau [Prevotella sp.]MDD7317446.1 DNA polymerase III subunit gamma/tau [Prevotellaceae bacterium]MDY4019218.1 DNA polymerase III subunit gamma/tau [Prevotella sp.]
MEYIVSARKYRPMSFDTVVGQQALVTTLKNAVKSGKLAHAYLFCGPRGVGKTTCARIFAKAINCEQPTPEGEACGVCESCKSFIEQRSYNIFELDAASNNSVENIKALMEQTRIPPQVGKYKVFIIDEVHMLSTAAFNAFLKTLEEPPAHVIFILATTEKHKILPTIISRCQIYDFERMTVNSTIEHLKMVAGKEGIGYEEEALAVIAEKADGGMRDALSIFDQAASFCQGNITYEKVIEDLNVLDSDNYFRITDLALENKAAEIMVLLNGVLAKGFDAGNLITGLAKHLRNVLMAKDPQTVALLETSQRHAERYKEQAQRCTAKFLYGALKTMNRCDVNYKQSTNKRLLAELTLIEMAQITQEEDVPGAGRLPRRLKSLFRKMITEHRSRQVAEQVAATGESKTVAAEAPQQESKEQKTDIPKKPLRLGKLGISFKTLRQQTEKTPEKKEEEEVKDTGEHRAFTEDELASVWYAMCKRMPQQMAGLSARIKNLQPKITEFPNVEVVVDNQLLLDDITKIKRKLLATLVKDLKNDDITLSLRKAREEEVGRVLTRREQYMELLSKNKAVAELQRLLSLELL